MTPRLRRSWTPLVTSVVLAAGALAASAAPAAAAARTPSLVGKRITVTGTQLLLYRDPARSYVGSLRAGQSFAVRRVSPSGRYAFGFAFGTRNQLFWVRTDQLR